VKILCGFAGLRARGRRMRAYTKARDEAAAMSDADLADIGLKRYQLGHVARVKALR
jgi:uncharacterized protein YjiS (DUF1127 family)